MLRQVECVPGGQLSKAHASGDAAGAWHNDSAIADGRATGRSHYRAQTVPAASAATAAAAASPGILQLPVAAERGGTISGSSRPKRAGAAVVGDIGGYPSNGSGARLTEVNLMELEALHKLHARKDKLVDVHGEDL